MPLSGRGGARATLGPQVKYTAASVRSSGGLGLRPSTRQDVAGHRISKCALVVEDAIHVVFLKILRFATNRPLPVALLQLDLTLRADESRAAFERIPCRLEWGRRRVARGQ